MILKSFFCKNDTLSQKWKWSPQKGNAGIKKEISSILFPSSKQKGQPRKVTDSNYNT